MSHSHQKTISNGFLDKLVNLKKLRIEKCNQDTISNGFLDKLTNLEILNMACCN